MDQNTSGLQLSGTGLTKGAENYIWSDTHFLEKRGVSHVGSSRSVSVARPCGSMNRIHVKAIERILRANDRKESISSMPELFLLRRRANCRTRHKKFPSK